MRNLTRGLGRSSLAYALIGYSVLWPICDLADRWFGLDVVVYLGCRLV
jgi:hypothetical protein